MTTTSAALLLALLQAEPGAETLGKPAPELVAASWVGSPVTLRGVKGNVVVLNFWNSDSAYFSSPEYFIRSMQADYDKYCKYPNITWVSICRSMTATPKQVQGYVEQYKLGPYPTMLDSGGATARAYKVPKEYSTWIVIIDAAGKIAHNDSKGWFWSSGPDKDKLVHHTYLERTQKAAPGITGVKELPPDAGPAAHAFDLQQFGLAEFEAKKLESKKSAETTREFAVNLKAKIAEVRKQRLAEIQEMQAAAPIQAYREAVAFVAAFPTSPERAPMNEIGKSLAKDAGVRKELQAEDAYRRIVVPELVKAPKGSADFEARVQPLLQGYLKVYGQTEYAAAVVDGVEGYKFAASRSR